MEDIGKILNGLRKDRGYSIRKVSEETGFSLSFLSKLENGKTSITIRNLIKLLSFYDVTLADVFSTPSSKKIAFRREERKVMESSEHIRLELVVDDPAINMEPLLATFEPNAKYKEPLEHGGEEFAFVIKGELRFDIEGISHYLREGDCVYFGGEKSHGWENMTGEEAHLLMVTTPPSV
jgi:transcriptional regulator with XRE-family HTH domain